MKRIERHYLLIANYLILLKLHPTERSFYFNIISNFIKKHLKGFIVNKNNQRISYTIDLLDSQMYLSIVKKQGNKECFYFNDFSIDKAKKTVYTSIFISGIMLETILKTVIGMLLQKKGGGFFLHCSSVKISNKAYIFTGASSSGKSTIASILSPYSQILADDTGIIKKSYNRYYFFQTPFIEKVWNYPRSYKKYPIFGVFFIHKSNTIRCLKINNKLAYLDKLINQTILLRASRNSSQLTFTSVKEFNASITLYHLCFNLSQDALLNLFKKMK